MRSERNPWVLVMTIMVKNAEELGVEDQGPIRHDSIRVARLNPACGP